MAQSLFQIQKYSRNITQFTTPLHTHAIILDLGLNTPNQYLTQRGPGAKIGHERPFFVSVRIFIAIYSKVVTAYYLEATHHL